jgi:hypothetical protein
MRWSLEEEGPVPEIRRETGFPIEIRKDETSRLLGYADRPVPDRVQRALAEIEQETASLIEPAWAILRAGPELLLRSPFLKVLDAAVLCLVTIGDGVEKSMEAYDRAGEIGKALITNVYGSAAAEAAADAANAFIREDIASDGLRCTRRFSPGYGGWDVAEQRWLLSALQGDALGVTLTGGCMMVPRKSITFAVNVGEHPQEMRGDNACDGCELINCQYRRESVIKEENDKRWTTFIGPDSGYCPLGRWS